MNNAKQHSRTPAAQVGSASCKIVTNSNNVGLHPRNKHIGRYDFVALVKSLPALKSHLIKNPKGDWSINFSDPVAVKLLNKALLSHFYQLTTWDIPDNYLCPPIPGRADYVHRLADLLISECEDIKHSLVKALDIGVGANCVYPIVGAVDYGWRYVASDVDPVSVKVVNSIVKSNRVLKGKVECRLQSNSRHLFTNIIQPNEFYDITMCNPPFHKSLQEAHQGTKRKLVNLAANRVKRGKQGAQQNNPKSGLNFGGQQAELWCAGGEAAFIKNMAFESKQFAEQVLWFSTLVSKKDNVRGMKKNLQKVAAKEIQIVEMSQGQKVSRFIAWTFKDTADRKKWFEEKK